MELELVGGILGAPQKSKKSLEGGPCGEGDHLQADSTLSTALNV